VLASLATMATTATLQAVKSCQQEPSNSSIMTIPTQNQILGDTDHSSTVTQVQSYGTSTTLPTAFAALKMNHHAPYVNSYSLQVSPHSQNSNGNVHSPSEVHPLMAKRSSCWLCIHNAQIKPTRMTMTEMTTPYRTSPKYYKKQNKGTISFIPPSFQSTLQPIPEHQCLVTTD